jgi:hypothetical protein
VSSAILYLAIVAIWAFLLVPRWIHRPSTAISGDAEAHFAGDRGAGMSAEDEYPDAAEPDDDTAPIPVIVAPPLPPVSAPPPAPEPAWSSSGVARGAPGARPALSRGKVLQARRRLLTILVLLGLAAGTCTVLRLSSPWVCVPPAVMLGLYVLLLRETAIADAERARWRAERAAAARHRALERMERAEAAARQAGAEIIDISARLTDQLYDQYADATVRAVGD